MRRWNLLFLGALVAVLAAVLITTPSRAMAAPSSSSSTSFVGKAVAKNTTSHYFVISFICSPPMTPGPIGTLSGKWTYEVNSTLSYSGTLGSAVVGGCALLSADGGVTWSTSSSGTPGDVSPFLVTLVTAANPNVGTLTLLLAGVKPHKTFFPTTLVPNTSVLCPSVSSPPSPFIEVCATGVSLAGATDFSSSDPAFTASFATLNLSVR